MAVGRFAPSPTGPLHLGNLRTALVAWLAARAGPSDFLLRVEDLDPSTRREHESSQLADLETLGIDWDGPIVRQSERRDLYEDAIADLEAAGVTYPCYCTRREIQEATRAPHGEVSEGTYPGTCRDLTRAERSERLRSGRPPALRLRAGAPRVTIVDRLHGGYSATVDDVVLRRNDGVPAYNLVVVVDDSHQGVEEVVRGDDLLPSSPRQTYVARLLGLAPPAYLHVPLVLGLDGERLAKRHGAVTLSDRRRAGDTPAGVRQILIESLGLAEPGETPRPSDLLARFDLSRLPREPWVLPVAEGVPRPVV